MLCPECRAVLNGAAPRRVRPVPEPPGLPVVHAAARYADAVRAVLLAHKERGALALAGPLGSALAGAVWAGVGQVCDVRSSGAAGGGWPGVPVLLVPVPSARQAVRARGHDPARRIALAAAGELRRAGMPARVVAVLRQRRGVADQSGLNSRQRLDNLAGALTVVPGGGRLLTEGLVVLVDDLMTTGASLAEAARAVREARVREGGPYRGERGGVLGEQMAAEGRDQRQRGVGERRGQGRQGMGECGGAAQSSGPGPSEPGERAAPRRPGAREWGGHGPSGPEAWDVRRPSESEARGGHLPPESDGRCAQRQAGTGDRLAGGQTEISDRAARERLEQPERWGTAGAHGERRQELGGRPGGRGVAGCGSEAPGVVYTAATRESMGERMVAVTEEDTARERCLTAAAGAGGVRDVICAAVVAASPDSFEINRN